MNKPSAAAPSSLASLLATGLGGGVSTGIVEGAGLLIFQRINWERWGPMMHVSSEIIWISPILDEILFLSIALLCGLMSRLVRRLPATRVLIFLLTFLTVYDWLTLTSRL